MLGRNKESQGNQPVFRVDGSGGFSRRSFIGGAVAGGVAVAQKDRLLNAILPHPHLDLPSLPHPENPFAREKREKTLKVVTTGIQEMAEFVPLKETNLAVVQVLKGARHFGFLFDSRATMTVSTTAKVTSDFSVFFPPTPESYTDATNQVSNALSQPGVPEVGMVGGVPALEISEDLNTVTITLPHPELPHVGDILPDFSSVKIDRGQGGLEDRIENFTGTSSIRDTELYIAAQKATLEKLKSDPTLILRAQVRIEKMLRTFLSLKFENVHINFVNPTVGPEMPLVAQPQMPNVAAKAAGK